MMDSLWTMSSPSMGSYFNISLVVMLNSCHQKPPQDEITDEESPTTSDEEEPIIGFPDVMGWLFESENDENVHVTDEEYKWVHSDDCHNIFHTSLGGSFSIVTVSIFVALSIFVILSILYSILKTRIASRLEEKLANITHKEETSDGSDIISEESQKEKEPVESVGPSDASSEVAQAIDSTITSNIPVSTAENKPVVITVPHTVQLSNDLSKITFPPPSSNHFLGCTVDHLQSQVDWLLGVSNLDQASSDNPMTMSIATTPLPQRKGSIRRPRWRTPVSVLFGGAEGTTDKSVVVQMWQKVDSMAHKMRWTHLDVGDLDISAVKDNRLSAVLQFYQQTCPVPTRQLAAASLIVNYTLTMIQQELASCEGNALQFVDFCSFGSAANYTCISRADRFDVLMVVVPSMCSELTIHHSGLCEDIAAGKVVMAVKDVSLSSVKSSVLCQKDHVGDVFGMFLSQKEVTKAAQKMLSNVLERLKLKCRPHLDRLPFMLQLDQYNDLQLSLDTRMLNGLGLGLSKITIKFTPAVRVSSAECDPLPVMYAVPPWKSVGTNERSDVSRSRLQSRIMRNQNQGIAPDLLWQLEGSELTKAFMTMSQHKIAAAGFPGCQEMCQQILRALFSRSAKDGLLSVGEIHPHILDSVVCFLLLESPTTSWALSFLPDRLSDCVHFLRSAVQSAWMPGFMVHNPHLLKRMPALKLLPLLSTGRQENLMANVGPDAAETMLTFIETRLQETGLRRCLKDEYSTDMWEYEFFIFG